MNLLKHSRLLNEKEVATLISKSVAWLQRARWEGNSIPYRKIGRSVRYFESEVLEWLDANAPKYVSTSEYKSKEGSRDV